MTEREMIYAGTMALLAGCPTLTPRDAAKIALQARDAVDEVLPKENPERRILRDRRDPATYRNDYPRGKRTGGDRRRA